MYRQSLALALALVILLPAGCRRKQTLEPTAVEREPETVRLLVVGDPALAEAIRRLKGQWHAVSGNTLEVDETPGIDAAADGARPPVPLDALIVPAAELGPLIEAGGIAPVPADVLDDPATAWNDLFLLVRQGVTWGDDVWGVPLGQPPLALVYRRDLFEKFGKSPPTTWTEYQALVDFFNSRDNLGDLAPPEGTPWHATLEPTARGWAGRLLLARAAAYAKHRDNYSTLFNIDTLEPLIAGEPFARALAELAAANGKDAPALDPAGVRAAFFAGQSAMALTWPTAAKSSLAAGEADANDAKDDKDANEPAEIRVGFAELPGAAQMYNYASRKWDAHTADESAHVPVISLDGRVGVVVKRSAHADAAWDLLVFLSGQQWGARVAGASSRTTLFRRSQLVEVTRWVEASIDRTASRQYGQVISDSLSRKVWVDGLRIAGSNKYYEALDQAVAQVLRGNSSPAAALAAAAEAWRKTTADLGLDRQKAAYRQSLGLDP